MKFRLNAGDEGDRQILSGIAQWYPNPEELVGKKVIAVTNLKPRKMRGEVSQGMLLSAEFGETVQLITVSKYSKWFISRIMIQETLICNLIYKSVFFLFAENNASK